MLLPFLQNPAKLVLSHRVDKQAENHNHNQTHDPLRLLQKHRGGEERGVFKEPEAPLNTLLPLILSLKSLEGENQGRVGKVVCG